jgi:hypothetical protein
LFGGLPGYSDSERNAKKLNINYLRGFKQNVTRYYSFRYCRWTILTVAVASGG